VRVSNCKSKVTPVATGSLSVCESCFRHGIERPPISESWGVKHSNTYIRKMCVNKLMSLSEREKLLFHMLSFLTTATLAPDMTKEDVGNLLVMIRKERCRKLSDKQVHELKEDLTMEFLLSKPMYEEKAQEIVNEFGRNFKEYL